MSTLFRVENPSTAIGLWYREDGVQVDFIRALEDARCRDLPMGHDPSLVGGWRSGTATLAQMADWLSASDVAQLAAHGHGLWAIEVPDHGWRMTTEPYVHAVFRDELVVARRRVPWDVLDLTP